MKVVRGVSIVLLAAGLGAGAIGFHYSGQILGPDAPPAPVGQTVLARTDSTITLASTFKARRVGDWAIEWRGGFGAIGPIVSADSTRVVTRFRHLGGLPPGPATRLAGFARDADPRTWLGIGFEDIGIPSRIGALPAWFVPGTDSTWAVFVHGRAATRAEVLRMLPAYRRLGLPCLVLSYRNDPDGPRVGDGSYRLGATEWQDLEEAVRWALAHGARDVVVVGCSMGGGIVARYLRESSELAFTRGAVLDAPALDWSSIISEEGRRRGVPGPITEWGKWVAARRGGLRWDDLSQIRHADEFRTPILIFHGDADETVPVESSVAFAAVRSDLVTLHIVKGAGHVESVNVEPTDYAAALAHWLSGLGPRPRRE